MLSEKDEMYLESITGKAERPKARSALKSFKEWLMSEHGHDEPTATDITEYEEWLTGRGITAKTIRDTMRRICKRYGVERPNSRKTKKEEQIQMSFEEKESQEPEVTQAEATTAEIAQTEPHEESNAGRPRFDTDKGEKRSEKLMLYLTPTLIAQIRAWCDMKGISNVSYITALIEEDLHSKEDKINAFLKMRSEL